MYECRIKVADALKLKQTFEAMKKHRIINKGRKLTRVGTFKFEVFVPAHVTPRILAAMFKESLLRSKH